MNYKTLLPNVNNITRLWGMLFLFLISTTPGFGQEIAYWNPAGQTGFGVSPYAVTTANANLTVTGLTRGPSVTTSGTASADAWGGNGWFDQSAGDYFTWTMTANAGFQQSLTSITLRYRRSASGPNAGTLYYSIDGAANVAIGPMSFPSTGTSGAEASITLSGVAALQNVPASSEIRFTFFPSGATHAGGTFYVYNGGTNGLRINGSVTVLPASCLAPTGLAANNITHESADLLWNTQAGATGYEYVVDQVSADPAASGTTTPATTYTATSLSASTIYYLHVRTDCGGGNFSPWTTLSFTTLVEPCDAPTGLAANNITHESANLSWNTQAGVTGYEYVVDQVSADPAASGTTTTATTYTATSLSASTIYYLHVRTDCGGGNFSTWTTLSFTTLVEPCDAPTGLAANDITHESADLLWDAQAGVAGYEYVVDQLAADPAASGTTTPATTYTATSLSASTIYYVHVRTDCGGGNFSPWTTISFTTLIEPCDAPTGLAANNITYESADLLWNVQAGVAGYEYVVDQLAADPAGSGTTTTATTYNATSLSASTIYYLHVRTDCGGGNFSPWTTISFTTLVEPCDAPTGLAANNITHESADLLWDAQAGVAGYEYVVDQVSADPAASGTTTTATTYNATGLSASTIYYLHVRTDCGGGNFSPWTTLPFTTLLEPCDAPTGLAANNITHESADLLWNVQVGVAGYEYVIDQISADPVASGTTTAATTYNATSLSASTIYYLHVRTDCGGGNFSPWTTLSFTTLVEPCNAPTGIIAGNITDESADLSWTAQVGVDGYEYVVDQTAAEPTGAGTPVATNAVALTSLNMETVYYVHVRTDCGNGNFSPWSTFSFTTDSNLGVEEGSADALLLYPNPVTDQLVVATTGAGTVLLINLEGKVLLATALNGTAKLDMTTLPAGAYTVKLVQNERIAIRKVIKL